MTRHLRPPPGSAAAPTFVGVDVGTSMAKAAAFDGSGTLLAVASRPIPLLHPAPERVEQDPEVIIGSVHACLAEVAGRTGNHAPELVALTGQGDGCWLSDGHGVPVRAAVSWMDGRAAAIIAEWTATGVCDAIFAENGNMVFPGAPGPILAWLDRHEPWVLDRAATAGHVKDLLLHRFTGVRATEATTASMPFGALSAEAGYSAEVLRLTGLAHRAELLAPVLDPLPGAALTSFGAGSTTLTPGTPIVSAPYDIPACALGAGRLQVGDGLLIVGTTLACAVVTDRVDTSGPPAGMTITMPGGRQWLRLMAPMVGTAGLDWLLNTLGLGFSQFDDLLDRSPAGANGVEVLPYLAPSGERAPFVDAAARASFSGVDLTTTRGDLLRGLCEGLAFSARSCFEAAGLTGDVYVCGGGSRSRSWTSIFASVLGRPLFSATEGQVGARGAILSAAESLGLDLDTWSWAGPQQVIDPDPVTFDAYADGYDRFCSALAAARSRWTR